MTLHVTAHVTLGGTTSLGRGWMGPAASVPPLPEQPPRFKLLVGSPKAEASLVFSGQQLPFQAGGCLTRRDEKGVYLGQE